MSVMRRKEQAEKQRIPQRKSDHNSFGCSGAGGDDSDGISVYRNHQKSQEEEQDIVDFSKLRKRRKVLWHRHRISLHRM